MRMNHDPTICHQYFYCSQRRHFRYRKTCGRCAMCLQICNMKRSVISLFRSWKLVCRLERSRLAWIINCKLAAPIETHASCTRRAIAFQLIPSVAGRLSISDQTRTISIELFLTFYSVRSVINISMISCLRSTSVKRFALTCLKPILQ